MENRFRHRDGFDTWMAWSYFPLLREGLAYGVGRDINEQKRAAEEREQLLQSERAAGRLKDEFLATLSHELRSPLVPIVTYAASLLTCGPVNPLQSDVGLRARWATGTDNKRSDSIPQV